MDDMFKTAHYRVLEQIYESSSKIGFEVYCPLTQKEIGEAVEMCRAKMGEIFADLRKDGYIQMLHRGKWQVTEMGEDFLKKTRVLPNKTLLTNSPNKKLSGKGL